MPRKTKTSYRRSYRRKKRYSFSALWRLFLLGIFVGVLVSYLVQVNYTSRVVYKTHDLRQKVKQLEEEKENLKFKVSEVKSLKRINEKLKELKMVAADKVEYLTSQGSVAKK